MRAPAVRLVAFAAALCVVATSCSSGESPSEAAAPTTAGAVTSTTAEPTTTSSSTTTSTTAAPFPGLRPGSSGPEVEALQKQLNAIKYNVGTVDGRYGGLTAQAVMAFQKVHGLERTGAATNELIAQIMSASPPDPVLAGAEPTRIEFDRDRQVLLVFHGGSLEAVLNASSGSGRAYCENGYCGDARTPAGAYRISRRISGWRISPLGRLYNPLYFNGGIAIHGAHSVPAYPASHGCVRINMSAAEWLPSLLPNGTPVYVIGGGTVPTPLNQRGEPSPTSAVPTTHETTTTTEPTSSSTSSSSSTTSSTTSTSTTTTLPDG